MVIIWRGGGLRQHASMKLNVGHLHILSFKCIKLRTLVNIIKR